MSTDELPAPSQDESTAAATPAEGEPVGTAPAKTVIVVDPGHGGTDDGETGAGGAKEKNVDLRIAEELAKELADTCRVVLTRTDDKSLASQDRTNRANAERADLFVSIHTGASGSPTANGFELYFPTGTTVTPTDRVIPTPQGTAAAGVSQNLARQISATFAKATSAGLRGIHSAPCRVFKGLNMPGVLIEVGCITNPTEESLLADADYQRKMARGIADGIRAYLAPLG